MPASLLEGDCLDILQTLPSDSVDSVVTDPPYGLSFMGKTWDYALPALTIWQQALRVLRPGGHLLSFAGTRTYHRLASAIEDAGFDIRDQIGWLYGSGFPKSLNLDGNWQGWGTALKPAWEPIVLARKPLIGTVAANLGAHGTGALNIDACRIEVLDAAYARNCSGDRGHADNRTREMDFAMGCGSAHALGRWPANVIHDGSDEVLEAFAALDTKTGPPSRFFYAAKASQAERQGSKHPTIKPVALMRYLCRLVTPKDGTVLDPFAGTGSTGQAAIEEGFNAILIEREAAYCADIRRRLGL